MKTRQKPAIPHHHRHKGHAHHHIDPASGDRKVAVAIAVNLGLTLAQIAAGVLSGVLAMIADAIHNLSDALSLLIAFAARKNARRRSDAKMIFGCGGAKNVAALANYTTLAVLSLWLIREGVARLVDPQPVAGWIVVIAAGFALVVDRAAASRVIDRLREASGVAHTTLEMERPGPCDPDAARIGH